MMRIAKAFAVLFLFSFLIVGSLAFFSVTEKSQADSSSKTANTAATKSKKKKKKKSKAASAAVPPKKVEEHPETPEEEKPPKPGAPAATASKKKKNKKKKKAESVPIKPIVVVEEPEAEEEEDDDDDDDDVARLLNKKQLAKAQAAMAGGGKKKRKKEKKQQQTEAVDESWVTVDKAETKETGSPAPAPDPNAVHSITLNLDDPVEDKRVLLGPKGTTIQGIQARSGARLDIDIPILKITGTEAAIAMAMEEVQSILLEYREEKRKATANSVTLGGIQIKGSEGVKAIIGRGGATIQAIQAQTGTKLDANIDLGTVIITGPTEEQVSQAATLCKHAVFGEAQHVIELKSRSLVMLIYGKDFQRIRQFQDDSGAKVVIEKGTTMLKLSGPTKAVQIARQMIESYLEHCKGDAVVFEASKIGSIYGKGGATIRRIQDRTGAFLEVDDDKGNKKGKEMVTCRILGEPAAVEQAKALVLRTLDGEIELKPGEVMEKIDLDAGAPAVIGRGGSKIRELEKTFSVKLIVNGDSGVCRIVGKTINVAQAKAEVEKIIQPILEEKRIKAEAERLAENAAMIEDGGAWGSVDDDADGW